MMQSSKPSIDLLCKHTNYATHSELLITIYYIIQYLIKFNKNNHAPPKHT